MIPVIENAITEQIEFVPYPSFTYNTNFFSETTAGDIDGLKALEQAIYHRFFTERYSYAIYDFNYGTELEQYIGKPFSFLEATIENTLKDSLSQDDRITDVKVTNAQKIDIDAALVDFDVYTNMGIISMGGVRIDI